MTAGRALVTELVVNGGIVMMRALVVTGDGVVTGTVGTVGGALVGDGPIRGVVLCGPKTKEK